MRSYQSAPLFRVENPDLPFNQQEGDYFAEELTGMWFDATIHGAFTNLNRVSYLSREYNSPAQLAIAVVTSDKLEHYLASNHPVASNMCCFSDDYIIPRDGSVPVFELDISDILQKEDTDVRGRIRKIAAPVVRQHVGRFYKLRD